MPRKIYCFFILVTLAMSSVTTPLHASAFRYSDEAPYETASKSIHSILSAPISETTPAVSTELVGYTIYNAFIVALQIMQESPIVAEVEYPVVAPDQSLFFIPYFPKAEPNTPHFIVLHRLPNPKIVAFYNFDGQGFNKFTSEHYKTRFYYVKTPKMPDGSTEVAKIYQNKR